MSQTSPILTFVLGPINRVLKPKYLRKNVFAVNTHMLFFWSLSPKNTVGQMFVQPCIVKCATRARDNLLHIRGLCCRLQIPHASMLRLVYGCGECQNESHIESWVVIVKSWEPQLWQQGPASSHACIHTSSHGLEVSVSNYKCLSRSILTVIFMTWGQTVMLGREDPDTICFWWLPGIKGSGPPRRNTWLGSLFWLKLETLGSPGFSWSL